MPEQSLSPRLRWLLDRLWQEWKQTEIDIKIGAGDLHASRTGVRPSSYTNPPHADHFRPNVQLSPELVP
jgi:hypothetical protein